MKHTKTHYRLLEVLKEAYDKGLLHKLEDRELRAKARKAIKQAEEE